jgi:hypothetical protein
MFLILMDLKNYEYVEVYLDSLDGIQTEGSYLSTDWPTFYINRPLLNIVAMKVIQAEVPFSYYVVNNDNNTFILTETGSTIVTLPVGNYNSSTLCTALETALTTASTFLGSRTYTVTYSSITQKLTVTASTGTFTLTFGTGTDSGQYNPRLVLGFGPGANSSSGSVLVAPYTAQISGPNYVYLNCTQIGGITDTYLPQNSVNLQSGQKGPQIARIPIACNPGDVSYYNDPVPEKWFSMENLRQIQNLDLYFTLGNQGPRLRFNGQNFSVKIGMLLLKDASSELRGYVGPFNPTRGYRETLSGGLRM